MRRPFPARAISSRFGWRVVPGTVHRHHHSGDDYAVPEGSAVRAIADGAVAAVRWHEQLGNVIEIKHDDDHTSKYMHLRTPGVVREGEKVTEGQTIGEVGNTGRSSRGAHLHLETWESGVCVDPETWFVDPGE